MFIQKADNNSCLHAIPTNKGVTLLCRVMNINSKYADSIVVAEVKLTDNSWVKLAPTIQTGKVYLEVQIHAVVKQHVAEETPVQQWDDKILLMISNSLLKGYDLEAYQKALAAKLKLAQAKAEYRQTMQELGATTKSEGTYGDTQTWLEIPNVPGPWPDL